MGYEQLQVFIEPKGTHLIAEGKWKEDFLLEIEDKAVATKIFVDDNKYKIWGFHFFNVSVKCSGGLKVTRENERIPPYRT